MTRSILIKSSLLALSLGMLFPLKGAGQTGVSKVYTDYNGFWNSSVAANSTDTPDASHLLLAFTYKNVTYSTGVSDAVLTSRGVAYQAANFQALSLGGPLLNGTGSVIGVGDKYGGGAGDISPVPVTNDLGKYLNDGIHGLDLGTAVFNLPAATSLRYPVNNFKSTAIGDSIPDILLTQVGQPPAAGSFDQFQFEDAAGNRIGNAISISLSGVSVVGTGKWKFYNPGTPVTYNAGLRGSRPLRMVGFDLADFGITAADVSRATRFVHKLSGQSDQAFIAYNATSFTATIGVALPVKLISFQAVAASEKVQLNWSVAEAKNADRFELERSAGNTNDFSVIATFEATATEKGSYDFLDATAPNGMNYYRLKMIEQDGSFNYSPIRSAKIDRKMEVSVYPNPATSLLYITSLSPADKIMLYNVDGKLTMATTATGNQLTMDVSTLPQGIYTLIIKSGSEVSTKKITIAH